MRDDEINNDADYTELEPVAEQKLCDYCSEMNEGAKWDENEFFELYCNAQNETAEQAFMCGFKTAISLILDPDKARQLDELSKAAFTELAARKKKGE